MQELSSWLRAWRSERHLQKSLNLSGTYTAIKGSVLGVDAYFSFPALFLLNNGIFYIFLKIEGEGLNDKKNLLIGIFIST